MIDDVQTWRVELLRTGAIVQDGDDSVSPEEAESQCLRYVSLLDMVEGSEDQTVFRALIDSMTAEHDYGVYESTLGAALRFPPERLGRWLYVALADGFLTRDPARAGNWLGTLASGSGGPRAIDEFNAAWANDVTPIAAALLQFVVANEEDGWLSSREQVGRLRPSTR